jgi:hypothetical protein
MTPRRLVILGVLAIFLGLFYTVQCWLLPVLYVPICNDHYHDREVCIAIKSRMYWSLLSPLPGIALIVVGRRRARRIAADAAP